MTDDKTILLAESGSTKTDWCLIRNGRKKNFQTQGINPYFMNEQDILQVLKEELPIHPLKIQPDEIHFYGAGVSSEDKKKLIEKVLKQYFGIKKVTGYSDMLAASRATCGKSKGIVCILGTGSNTCFYDGKKMGFKTPSLGYVLGDEGGGSYIGKKVLQYVLHEIFEPELLKAFHQQFQTTREEILENLYRRPFPNRYLAQFTQFVFAQRGHYMIENIAEDCLNDLFIHHLLRYPGIHRLSVHFTGSVSWHLQDLIVSLCEQYHISPGTFLQKPIKGLIAFHAR